MNHLGAFLALFLLIASVADMVEMMLGEDSNMKEFSVPLILCMESSIFIIAFIFDGRTEYIIAYVCFLFNTIICFTGIFFLAIFPDSMLNMMFSSGSNSNFLPPEISSLDIEESRKILCSFFILMGSIMATIASSASSNLNEKGKKKSYAIFY